MIFTHPINSNRSICGVFINQKTFIKNQSTIKECLQNSKLLRDRILTKEQLIIILALKCYLLF